MAKAQTINSPTTRTGGGKKGNGKRSGTKKAASAAAGPKPTGSQRDWLARGLSQPGGKLPLFDQFGQQVSERTVRSCIEHGWAEPWFSNPLKPDWLICRLTDQGRAAVEKA